MDPQVRKNDLDRIQVLVETHLQRRPLTEESQRHLDEFARHIGRASAEYLSGGPISNQPALNVTSGRRQGSFVVHHGAAVASRAPPERDILQSAQNMPDDNEHKDDEDNSQPFVDEEYDENPGFEEVVDLFAARQLQQNIFPADTNEQISSDASYQAQQNPVQRWINGLADVESPSAARDSAQQSILPDNTDEPSDEENPLAVREQRSQASLLVAERHERQESLDEEVAIEEILAWETRELEKRDRSSGQFTPTDIYAGLKNLIRQHNKDNPVQNWTAFEITTMVVSLGSAESLVQLKGQLEVMRKVRRAVPDLTETGATHIDSLLSLAKGFLENSVAFHDMTTTDQLNYRFFLYNFCRIVHLEKDRLMSEEVLDLTEQAAIRAIYATVVSRYYPKLTRYKASSTGEDLLRIETSSFRKRVEATWALTHAGHRWFSLARHFTVGLLGLYVQPGSFSGRPTLSLDSTGMCAKNFAVLKAFLTEQESDHCIWLGRIGELVADYINAGMRGTLRLPSLQLELTSNAEILSYREQSEELAALLGPAGSFVR